MGAAPRRRLGGLPAHISAVACDQHAQRRPARLGLGQGGQSGLRDGLGRGRPGHVGGVQVADADALPGALGPRVAEPWRTAPRKPSTVHY